MRAEVIYSFIGLCWSPPSGLHRRVPSQSCQSAKHFERGGKIELE